ncbi:MAG TPA: pyridoxal phosphate-dependent aminotransferase [Terriglobales bacterium]|nr:pyridoxal phosphate-dependent aminotransferase [Terriglobales bacterium]
MKTEFAERMHALGTETAFEVLAHARRLEAQGRNIIHLEIGEPDFDTPIHITEAAMRALQDGYTHYTPAVGLLEARAAVAEYVSHTRGITATPEQVVLVPGSKNILLFALLSLVNPGDEVIYPDPGYPIYESLARFVGATLRPIRLREENDFRFDLDEFRALLNPRTRLIILNSPHNPCGSVLERSDIEAIAEAVQETDAYVLSDEIYSRIQYEGTPYSILAVPGMQERSILMDGLSKAYAMTGWRLGFGVMNTEIVEKMSKLMINSSSCAAAFTQMAAIAALLGPQNSVDEMVTEFRTRRDLIVHELNQIHGVHARLPKGAFYVLANVAAIDSDAKHLSNLLLEEGGIACLPGTAFGEGGQGYLRFSYANSQEKIREGMRRMKETLARVELAV